MEEQVELGNRDDNMSWEIAGQSKEMERSLQSMQLALYLAVFLVYVIIALLLNRLHPFIILFSVPLAFIGTIWCLALFGMLRMSSFYWGYCFGRSCSQQCNCLG